MRLNGPSLSKPAIALLALAAMASFHLTYSAPGCQLFIVLFFYCLVRLASVETARQAFYIGLAIGLGIYSPHLAFFWKIFHAGSISLWLILACWLGLFLLIGQLCRSRFGLITWACLAPFVWMGLEYFRSELYYLKFSWLNAGYAFSTASNLRAIAFYGVYGIGFLLMALAAFAAVFQKIGRAARMAWGITLMILLLYPFYGTPSPELLDKTFRVTGVQLEFPSAGEAVEALNRAIQKYPDTELFVLSEYTFTGPVPQLVKNWCRKHQKYLALGAEDPASGDDYFDTAFVVGPTGEIIFRQAKSVPVQFMKDGLAATNQSLWQSPWGKLGFGICYDLSYTRVADELIRQGAQGLIFPTMDIQDWGEYEHRLHGRIAPLRAAEFRVPVFRLCSSGVSQIVDADGRVSDALGFPGEGEILTGPMQLVAKGRIPPDRALAKLSVGITAAVCLGLVLGMGRRELTASVK